MFDYPTSPAPLEERQAATQTLRDVSARLRSVEIEAARALRRIEVTGAHWKDGAASLREYAERHGMAGSRAKTYAALGRALEWDPGLEDHVRRGVVPVDTAAILGDARDLPESVSIPYPEWLRYAQTEPTHKVRRRYQKALDTAHAGQPVVPLRENVTPEARNDMDRARVLLARRAHEVTTMGQTIGTVFAEWLDGNDPLRTAPGIRRVANTATLPYQRYVPAEVERAVRARTDDRCAVSFCDHPFWIELAHFVPHRDGSGRETGNLLPLCDFHNFLHEKGDLVIEGTAENPIFRDRSGRRLDERRPYDAPPIPPDVPPSDPPVEGDQRPRPPP